MARNKANGSKGSPTSAGSAYETANLCADAKLIAAQIRSSLLKHYVYVLHRPDGQPFYVGKGVNLRVLNHLTEARITTRLTHKLNVIRSILKSGGVIHYNLDSFHEVEAGAHARERNLIQSIGRHGLRTGPLTNQTDGGEGASNLSEESKERHRQSLAGLNADDPDRRIANRFLRTLIPEQKLGSATLKSAIKFRAEPLHPNRERFAMSMRQAATLVASAVANQIMLAPGCRLPRRLIIEDRPYVIENGVGKDMLVSGMIVLADATPGYEIFEVTPAGYDYILSSLQKNILQDFGIVEPDV